MQENAKIQTQISTSLESLENEADFSFTFKTMPHLAKLEQVN